MCSADFVHMNNFRDIDLPILHTKIWMKRSLFFNESSNYICKNVTASIFSKRLWCQINTLFNILTPYNSNESKLTRPFDTQKTTCLAYRRGKKNGATCDSSFLNAKSIVKNCVQLWPHLNFQWKLVHGRTSTGCLKLPWQLHRHRFTSIYWLFDAERFHGVKMWNFV